jgi:hypothetical protein
MFNLPVIAIPTSSLAWGGWFMDYLLRWLPAGLAANAPCFVAIMLALGITRQKNSLEIMTDGYGAAKLAGVLLLFCIAMYAAIATTSSVFLYFNF